MTEYERLLIARMTFCGPDHEAAVTFKEGVNVICGSSDTGKSFLAESVDYMLGGSGLREIPERTPYSKILMEVAFSTGEPSVWERSTSGGDFAVLDIDGGAQPEELSAKHAHNNTQNLSGFLLAKIGLLGKRVLRSKKNGTTQSLSFRNIARLVIVQEEEIQQKHSPFLSGQFVTQTPDLATVKLLLTGIDDSDVVSAQQAGTETGTKVSFIDEMISELQKETEDTGFTRAELEEQTQRLDHTVNDAQSDLAQTQKFLSGHIAERRRVYQDKRLVDARVDEIAGLLSRFDLLASHYSVDLERLNAVSESGSFFSTLEFDVCPLCGSEQLHEHNSDCWGDVPQVVQAANSEIEKIKRLQAELEHTVEELNIERTQLAESSDALLAEYDSLDEKIREAIEPQHKDLRRNFNQLVESKLRSERNLDLFRRLENLERRRADLVDQESGDDPRSPIQSGIPDAIAFRFSKKVSAILKAWNFPGNCEVHFDKTTSDFVIDGKPRTSRGKGLRAITHAAISIGLLEFCKENNLPHPGFVLLDSPLLAYFKPENDDEEVLRGTNLKRKFYEYLLAQHRTGSQVLIIENQHPPEDLMESLNVEIFTANPNSGRFGLL